MSLRPDTIAIRNKPFVKRIMKLAKERKAKTLSGVVQELCEAQLDRLSDDGNPHTDHPQPRSPAASEIPAESNASAA